MSSVIFSEINYCNSGVSESRCPISCHSTSDPILQKHGKVYNDKNGTEKLNNAHKNC